MPLYHTNALTAVIYIYIVSWDLSPSPLMYKWWLDQNLFQHHIHVSSGSDHYLLYVSPLLPHHGWYILSCQSCDIPLGLYKDVLHLSQ